jgi:hypothetical protein
MVDEPPGTVTLARAVLFRTTGSCVPAERIVATLVRRPGH